MLELDVELRWSPQYHVVEMSGGGAALLGPARDLLLSAEQLGPLVPGRPVVPREHLRGLADPVEGARRLRRLEGMVEAGLLVPAAGSRSCEPSPFEDDGASSRRLGWPEELGVVLASRSAGGGVVLETPPPADGAWVLVAPAGERSLVGPLFDPSDAERPCWRCLDEQLRRNRPLRRWLLHHAGARAWGPHPLASAADVGVLLERMAERPQILDELRAQPVVLSLDERSPSPAWTRHFVRRLPHCPDCGVPQRIDPASDPLVLVPTPVGFHDDGGWRTQAPSVAVEGLLREVSPLTGLFRECRPLHRSAGGLSAHQVSHGVCPLDLAHVEGESFVEAALGKGISVAQSTASALGEAVERIAAGYRGDEHCVVGTPAELPAPAIEAAALAPFSERQYQAFESEGGPDAVLRRPGTQPIEWVPVWSLVQRAIRYVPASYCYAHGPFEAARYCRFTSNGAAAGSGVEDAIVQGLFEIVERDAVSIWWYGRLTRPGIPRAPWWQSDAERVDVTLGPAWEWWSLDLTHDFELPVVAAVARHRHSGRAGFGFGCHLDPRLALRRALTELGQLVVAGESHARAFDLDGVPWQPFLMPASAPPSRFAARPSFEGIDLREVILDCVARAEGLGLEVLVHRYVRPELPLQVVKVVVPGSSHVWPRLGCRRLYEVPVALGWLERPLREEELNPVPLWL